MKKKKFILILFHAIGWALFLALPFLLRPPSPHHMEPPKMGVDPIYFSLVTNLLLIPFFYFNIYFLFPRLVSRRRYGPFVGAQLLMLVGLYFIKKGVMLLVFRDAFHHFHHNRLDVFFIFTFLFVALMAFSYGMIMENMRADRLMKEKETQSLKTELQFLRWQVNPHFLFNAINNMVALARLRSDKLEPLLIRLSTLMRYMLYETNGARIPLSKEVDYLQSYIELQCIRMGDLVKVHVDFDVDDASVLIEPMLLIPFIENAFKHGTGLVREPFIDIKMNMEGSTLNFFVSNTYVPEERKNKDSTSGIGLANARRRLALIYKDKFVLDIRESELFTVSLKIDLQ